MEERVKAIVATFIRIPADAIGPATPIDRRAVKSSIMLHRMYAKMAEEGFAVTDYASVKVFGDLFVAAGGGDAVAGGAASGGEASGREASGRAASGREASGGMSGAGAEPVSGGAGTAEPIAMGIDIESVEAMPKAADFRRDEFYKMNFTPKEIAYCILQPDPYSSFAGLFAAKEALVKADGSIREMAFNQISIGHSEEGKPLYPGFTLSIAHANGTAVAVAARGGGNVFAAPTLTLPTAVEGKGGGGSSWIAWLALLLAAATLAIVLLKLVLPR